MNPGRASSIFNIIDTPSSYNIHKVPDCKVLFLRGELFVVNGSCVEMKVEHFQSFLYLFSQGPTYKRQNKSIVHQKCADFVGFS
jgi:hypothetical protein